MELLKQHFRFFWCPRSRYFPGLTGIFSFLVTVNRLGTDSETQVAKASVKYVSSFIIRRVKGVVSKYCLLLFHQIDAFPLFKCFILRCTVTCSRGISQNRCNIRPRILEPVSYQFFEHIINITTKKWIIAPELLQ